MANVIELQLIVDDKGTPTIKSFSKGSERSVSSLARTISQKAGGAMRKFGRLAGTTMKKVSRMVFSLKSAFIGLAVYGLARVISGFEKLSGVQEQAEAGMMAAMKSMGRYTKGFEDLIKKTASGIQTQSTFGDEAVLMGTKFLMTYGNISNQAMPRVMKAMTDLSALMKGDFTSAANMLGKASMGMVGELRKAGITVDSNAFKTKGFLGVLEQIEAQIRGQAKALRETEAGGLKAFGNVVGDVKEKFGLFTSTVKGKIARVLLPHVEKLNEKLAEWIGSGQMEADAKRWADAIINAMSRINEKLKILIEFMQDVSDKWEAIGGTGGIVSGAGMSGFKQRYGSIKGRRYGSDAKVNAFLDEHWTKMYQTPDLSPPAAEKGTTPFAAGGPENKALEVGLQERLAMLTGHHDAALVIMQAQQTMWLEAEAAKNESMKAFSAEKISLDQAGHDAALSLMQSEQEAFLRMEEMKRQAQRQAVHDMMSNAAFFFNEMGKKNKAAFQMFKAISIAQTIMKTYEAAQSAYAAMAGIPIVGPALGAAAAMAAIAAGMARVQAIRATQPGGGAAGMPGGGSVSATTSTAPYSGGGSMEAQGGLRIIIYGDFYGDEAFVDRLAEKINYAVENRHVRVVSSEIV